MGPLTRPAWLAERPWLLVRAMSGRNALRRSSPGRALGVLLVLALAAPAVPAVTGARDASVLARLLAGHPLEAFAGAAVVFAALAARRKRRLAAERTRSWVAPLPVREAPLERAAAGALVWLAMLEWLLVAATAAARWPPAAAAPLLLVVAAGAVAGFWAGWFAPRARRQTAPPRSSRARNRTARPRWASRAALTPLGFWPVARMRWWSRPRVAARWMAPLLLAVPMGTAAQAVLASAVAWLAGLYLLLLTLAVVRTAFAASWWLAPTGIGWMRFGAALAGVALAEQAVICTLALAAGYALAGPGPLAAASAAALGFGLLSAFAGALAAALALRPGRIASSWLQRRAA